jgi:anaerobic selenocysteine-containing dehydrogenase
MAIRQVHTYCAMCVSRCGVLATVEDGRLTKVTADPEHPNGCICVKGTAAPEIVYSPDRLRHPQLRTRPKDERDAGWTRIGWDDALGLMATRLSAIKARYGPAAVVFGSATTAGAAAMDFYPWVQRLANAFGSPNFLYANHVCAWHRTGAAQYTYGTAMPQPDYDHARCILLWGCNPQASQPADAMRISRAVGRGARLIVIDPRRAGVADKADLWLRVRPGRDAALALAMTHVLIDEGLYDAAFVRQWTNGPFLVRADTGQLLTERDLTPSGSAETFVAWDSRTATHVTYRADRGYGRDDLDLALSGAHAVPRRDGTTVACRPVFALLAELAAEHAPERSERSTWVPAADVRRAVRMFAAEQPSCYFTWVGLEEHANATQMNRAVSLFYALTGQFDRRGSNVLFAATPTNPILGRELLPQEQATRRLGYAERPLGPPSPTWGVVTAYDLYRAVLSEQPYPVKGLVNFGTDLIMGNSEPRQGKAALEALDFYVHVDLFANPSAAFADLLLPAASCWEREALRPSLGIGRHTANWAQLRERVIAPLHESRSEIEIIFDLAARLRLGEHFFGGDLAAAYAHELAPSGLTVEQLRKAPMGLRAPHETRYQKYAEIDATTGRPRGFPTPTRKVELYSTSFARAGHAALPTPGEPARGDTDAEFPLALTFYRLVQYCDVQHRNIARLRRQVPEPFLEIHPTTAAAAHVDDGEWVVVETAAGRIRLKARFKESLHPRVVATAHGWWQACSELGLPGYDPFGAEGSNANLLVANDVLDPISGSVPHRSQQCRVRKDTR